jgi:hypothetical protein
VTEQPRTAGREIPDPIGEEYPEVWIGTCTHRVRAYARPPSSSAATSSCAPYTPSTTRRATSTTSDDPAQGLELAPIGG